jgi:uncharacterized Zn-finger protein
MDVSIAVWIHGKFLPQGQQMLIAYRKHINKHIRPFKCSEGCGRSFARNSCRQRHESAVHFPNERYRCTQPECQKAGLGFSRKDHLTQHMNTHAVQSGAPLLIQQTPTEQPLGIALPQKDADFGLRKRPRNTVESDDSNTQNDTLSVQILRKENERLKAQLRKNQETLDSIGRLISNKVSL